MSGTSRAEPKARRRPRRTPAAKGAAKGARQDRWQGRRRPTGNPRRRENQLQPEASAADPRPPRRRPRPPPSPRLHLGVAALTADQRAQIETLSMNLARAALTAQGAIAEMALRNAERPAALSPDPFHVAPALSEVMARLAAQPDRLMRAQADLFSRYLELWQATARRAGGEPSQPIAWRRLPRATSGSLDPEWSGQSGLRCDQAVVPPHRQLDERPGVRGGGCRPDGQAPGRVLHEDADRRLLAVELPGLQSGGAARGDGHRRWPAWSRAWRTSRPT